MRRILVPVVATALVLSLAPPTAPPAGAASDCSKSVTVTDPGDTGAPGQLRTARSEASE